MKISVMTPRPSRALPLFFFLLASLLVATSCKGDHAQKGSHLDLLPEGDRAAMLDEPIEGRRTMPAGEAGDEDSFFIPLATDEMPFSLDGNTSDWSDYRARDFDSKSFIVDGKKHWKGSRDAGLEVRSHRDENFIYFALFARDETVLMEGQDSILISLRDPKLEEMKTTLPQGVNLLDELVHDVNLTIYPDGAYNLQSAGDVQPRQESVSIAPLEGVAGGWGAEVAIAIEALPFVASLPVSEIAFRMELRDGDSKRSQGYQTLLEILPTESGDPPRYALLSMEEQGGFLPHLDTKGAVLRADGVGYWRQEASHWTYHSLEQTTKTWRLMADASKFLDNASDTVSCPSQDQELLVLEAYRTRSGRHRVGLFLCLQREDKDGACDREARTQLYWMHLMRGRDEALYERQSMLEVFDEPLPQCRIRPALQGGRVATSFGTLPLDFVNANVWAVSWKESTGPQDDQYSYLRHATRFINARSGKFMGPSQTLLEREDDGRERRETINMNYFIKIDGDEHYDICEIGRIREQDCKGFQQGCKTRQHGEGLSRYVQLWKQDKNLFERQLIRHHPNCPSDISLSKREGYLLFHTGSRVGLLPSILNKEE